MTAPRDVVLREGAPPTLFCIHPVTGDVGCYAELASAMAARRVVGIEAASRHADVALPRTIEAIAAQYRELISSDGPILLLGWSTGGLIAYEIALQAHLEGVAVLGVVSIEVRVPVDQMVDPKPTTVPTELQTLVPLLRRLHHLGGGVMPTAAELEPLSRSQRTELVRQQAIVASILPAGASMQATERLLATFGELGQAHFAYRPARSPVPLLLVEAADSLPEHPRPATLGWERCATSIESIRVPGNLFDLLSCGRAAAIGRHVDRWAGKRTESDADE